MDPQVLDEYIRQAELAHEVALEIVPEIVPEVVPEVVPEIVDEVRENWDEPAEGSLPYEVPDIPETEEIEE